METLFFANTSSHGRSSIQAVRAYRQGGDARFSSMKSYATRHEHLIWFEKPGGERTFNALEGALPYTESERRESFAKSRSKGVTEESLLRGRPPRSFLDIPRVNSNSKQRRFGSHPCMKPLPLCEKLIKVHSNENDVIVIPFAGSGSEMVSACILGRKGLGFEENPTYSSIARESKQSN